jgi:putative protease
MEKNINKKNSIKNKGIGVETFIHGAMCVSVSGRCFISQFLFDKSANRGDCLQPCRREYVVKDPEEGHKLKLDNNYVMSPKDLCTLGFIDKLIESGSSAFKIEGRNRSPEYVKTVVSCYRAAIDAYFDGKLTDSLKKKLVLKLKTVYNRGFSSGFYLGKPNDEDWSGVYGSSATTKKKYVGFVRNFYKKVKVAEIKLEAGDVKVGDEIMFQGPTTGVVEEVVKSMELDHKKVSNGKKGQHIAVKVSGVVRERDKVYLVVKS